MFTLLVVVAAAIGAVLANPPVPLVHHPEGYYHHAPKPYKFGYSIKDHHGEQHREESGTGGNHVVGSYGFTDDRGIKRQVNYVADHGGFRAEVKTNEPGTANQNPAAVHIISDAPAFGHLYGGIAGYGLGGYLDAPVAHVHKHHEGYGLGYAGYAEPYAAGYGYGAYPYNGGYYGGYGYGL